MSSNEGYGLALQSLFIFSADSDLQIDAILQGFDSCKSEEVELTSGLVLVKMLI